MPALRAVVGLDVGGTSSTAAVLATDGAVLAVVEGPGANFRSSPGTVVEHLRAVLAAAAARTDARLGGRPWQVDALVAGIAGAGPAGRDRAVALLHDALPGTGMPAPATAEVVTDPVVAYAAGAPGPDGALLLAGTGAVALRVAGFAEQARSDGLGWLLGDVGSGVWLALAGLRAAAAHLDGRGPATALTPAATELAAAAGAAGTGDPRQDLVRLTDTRSPAELGSFAREVAECAADGDAVAAGIVAEGVAGLLRSLRVVADGATDVVLAGSVLTRPGPVREGVLAGLRTPASDLRVHDAAAPVVGSLRLAADRAGWPLPDVAALTSAVGAARG
jgi:N-acetylglucosamine kinase-like BadF-type ATPase